jgi:PAS domain S-box-containing protein
MDCRIQRFDKEYRWTRDDGAPFFDEKGVFQGFIGSCFDVTEAVESRRIIEERDSRFQLLVNSIDEIFWMIDPVDNKMIYVSPAFERLWGSGVADLYSSPNLFVETIHLDDRGAYLEIVKSCHSAGKSYECDYRILGVDGNTLRIFEKGYPVYGDDGELIYMASVCTDISEQRALEE